MVCWRNGAMMHGMASFEGESATSAEEPDAVVSRRWEWHVHPDEETMSQAVAARLAVEFRQRRNALICLASGASPKRAYELLVEHARAEPDLYSAARWVKLDEWGGLAMDDPGSCEQFLQRVLLAPLGVPPERYFGWESRPADAQAECRRVAAWLGANGPIDIQVLGLGENGHIGFNEPAQQFQSSPHVAALSAESLSHSMLGRSKARPAYGLTLGMGDILGARRILLLVAGERKARQLQRLVSGEISSRFPASMLRRCERVSVFCDLAAASLIRAEVLRFSTSRAGEPV
jgi:galactosamine-6-phosphate isomerase